MHMFRFIYSKNACLDCTKYMEWCSTAHFMCSKIKCAYSNHYRFSDLNVNLLYPGLKSLIKMQDVYQKAEGISRCQSLTIATISYILFGIALISHSFMFISAASDHRSSSFGGASLPRQMEGPRPRVYPFTTLATKLLGSDADCKGLQPASCFVIQNH